MSCIAHIQNDNSWWISTITEDGYGGIGQRPPRRERCIKD